jgi:GR25 family glycosyltransferase involved in LPS biosynthesis
MFIPKFSIERMKAYCINLDRDAESWKRSKDQFEIHSLEVQRFSAVNGSELEIPDLCPNSGEKFILSKGGYGCFLSHLKIIELAKEQNLDYVMIFEDDVELCDDFGERLKYLSDCNISFDMFYFGGAFNHYTSFFGTTENKHIFQFQGAAGTYAYIISKSIFDYVLQNARFDRAIDGFYATVVGNQPDDRLVRDRRFDIKGFLPLAACAFSRVSSDSGLVHTPDRSFFQKERLDLKTEIFSL